MSIVLKKHIFDEVTNPTGLFRSEDIIAITHDYHPQTPARHIKLRKICVSLYNKHTLELVAHFNHARYPINDVAFHPDKPQVLISTGTFDGGYMYEGELILWNYQNKQHKNLLKDNREILNSRFIDNHIEFTISPQTEDENECETYTVSQSATFPVSLSDCQKLSEAPYENSPYNEVNKTSLIQQINEHIKHTNKTYTPSYMAWDIVFINEHTLAVGLNNSTVEIWNIQKQTYQTIKLAPDGACAQLFYDEKHHILTINSMSWNYAPEGETTHIYQIDLTTFKARKVYSGRISLSKNKAGLFFGRQINFRQKTDKDILFNEQFFPLLEKRLGHYDLFNHYIRIDGGEHFFALISYPNDQHTHKSLIEIDLTNGQIIDQISIDPTAGHYMNLCAILIKDHFVVAAEIYKSDPWNKDYTLFSINKNTKSIDWQCSIPSQVTCFCASTNNNHIFASLTNGEIHLINLCNGKTIQTLNKTNLYSSPLSLSRHGNKLAVGYDDGMIEIFTLENSI